jgi:hypothetical protein
MKKFLIFSLALMLLFYAMSLPFLQSIRGVDELNEFEKESKITHEIQMTSTIGFSIIIVGFLLLILYQERVAPKPANRP